MTSLYQDKDSTPAPASAVELTEQIETDIARGRIEGGERLPSIREMAVALSLAPNTVATAYRRLADRGVIVSRGRAGTFVLDRPPLAVHRSLSIPPGSVDLGSGSPDPRLLPSLDRFVTHTGPSTSYIDPPILSELTAAGRSWLVSQGLDVDRLIVTSGALDAIERVLNAHLRPGDAVAVEQPGWSAVTDLVAALGLRAVGIEIDQAGMIPSALAARLNGVDAVIVTPRAQNPIGAAIDADRRDELAEVLSTVEDVLVVEDDHAGPIAGAPLHPLGHRRRWAFIQSVAKALGPDLRLALVAGDDLTLDRVGGRFGIGPGWVSRILQHAVVAMMTDNDVASLLEDAAVEYGRRREALVDALRAKGLADATGRSGLNVWTTVASEDSAITGAADAGFIVRGGATFGSARPAVRITVSNLEHEDIPLLVAALTGGGDVGRRLV